MKSHPVFDCYFITQRPDVTTPHVSGDTFYSNGIESIPTIVHKTFAAFEYFADKNYDFVLRTNLSSVWNFKNYADLIETLPKTGLYHGICGPSFVSGAGFLVSPDVIQLMLANREEIYSYKYSADDWALGQVMKRIGVPFTAGQRTDFNSMEVFEKTKQSIPPTAYHFRCKFVDGADRKNEPELMRRVLALTQ